MSAFICSPEHIAQLAIAAKDCRVPFNREQVDAKTWAQELAAANWRSIVARYDEDSAVEMSGFSCLAEYQGACAREARYPDIGLKPVDLLKMADCFDYQSCEARSYRQSEYDDDYAGRWHIEYLKGCLVSKLPGYNAAPWGYERARRVA